VGLAPVRPGPVNPVRPGREQR